MGNYSGGHDQRGVDRGSSGTGGCPSGKIRHPTRAAAKTHERQAQAKGRHRMRPYSCDQCDGWHIGHLPTAVREGRTTAGEWYERRQPPGGVGVGKDDGSPKRRST